MSKRPVSITDNRMQRLSQYPLAVLTLSVMNDGEINTTIQGNEVSEEDFDAAEQTLKMLRERVFGEKEDGK